VPRAASVEVSRTGFFKLATLWSWQTSMSVL
jgi:hypothetical protein